MANLIAILRYIVGRVKRYMYTAGLTFGLMLIPLGYYLIVEGKSPNMWFGGILSITMGITLFLIGWIRTIQQESKSKKDNEQKFQDILTEIRGLRQDIIVTLNTLIEEIRQERNERRNRNG